MFSHNEASHAEDSGCLDKPSKRGLVTTSSRKSTSNAPRKPRGKHRASLHTFDPQHLLAPLTTGTNVATQRHTTASCIHADMQHGGDSFPVATCQQVDSAASGLNCDNKLRGATIDQWQDDLNHFMAIMSAMLAGYCQAAPGSRGPCCNASLPSRHSRRGSAKRNSRLNALRGASGRGAREV